nr:hypothetical protein [Tanacetum cinerariifolium]
MGLENPQRLHPVGPKVGFKPVKQVYRHVSKKNNANTSGNKKKDAESRKEVSNSNPFDVLNSVENDVNLGTNRGTSNLAGKEANPSGSSVTYENVDYDYDPYNDDMYKGHDVRGRTKIDVGETIFNDLIDRLSETPRKKHMSYHTFISYVLEELLGADYAQDQSFGSTPWIL